MMETASTSETLVNFYHTTRRYKPEDSHLYFFINVNKLREIVKNLRLLSSSETYLITVGATRLFSIVVFWILTRCGLVCGDKRFRGIYRLHLQGKDTFLRNVETTYKTTWRDNSEDRNRHLHRRENLKTKTDSLSISVMK
jgi:hypothetical protein